MASDYIEFINKHFLGCDQLISKYADILYTRIIENNCFTSILLAVSERVIKEDNLDVNYIKFIIRYKDYINRTLMYFPINDSFGIKFCLRNGIECILKYLYCLHKKCIYGEVNFLGYRALKEELLKSRYKTEVGKLCSIYALLSNDIHGKYQANKSYVYVENIICKELDYAEYDRILIKIINSYENIFIDLFNLDQANVLMTYQKLQIKRINIGDARRNRLVKMLNI